MPDRSNKPPTFATQPKLPLCERLPQPEHQHLINKNNSYLRVYILGPCSVIVTREYELWHLSIAHPSRYPTWDEVAEARYRLIPGGATMTMALPPQGEYVNIHPNCFQLQQTLADADLLNLGRLVMTGQEEEVASFARALWLNLCL